MNDNSYLTPDWDIPATIHAAMTLCGSDRQTLKKTLNLPSEPIWLNQTHSNKVIQADRVTPLFNADASFTSKTGIVCGVLTADCLPLLLCSENGESIAAIHAGWRGLLAGIITNTLKAMQTTQLSVWLGAAISSCCFEVDDEIRQLFIAKQSQFHIAFIQKSAKKYLADIYQLARIELNLNGVNKIYGGHFCTVCDPQRFYSYRRNKDTGRMATLIWKQ